jgi:hypothetical protein
LVDRVYPHLSYLSAIGQIDITRCGPAGCSAKFGADIALVHIENAYTGPVIRVSASKEDDPLDDVRTPVVFSGFGNGNLNLLETVVPTVPRERCQARYNREGYNIRREQICAAAGVDRHNGCQGDPGGHCSRLIEKAVRT